MHEDRKRLFGGCFAVAVGVLTGAAIYAHPEKLHAPAWVACAACLAFVFAGLSIIAAQSRFRRAQAWLVAACMLAMLMACVWVAIGAGSRRCSVSIPWLDVLGSELLCRGAFGFGSIVLAGFLLWVVLTALTKHDVG